MKFSPNDSFILSPTPPLRGKATNNTTVRVSVPRISPPIVSSVHNLPSSSRPTSFYFSSGSSRFATSTRGRRRAVETSIPDRFIPSQRATHTSSFANACCLTSHNQNITKSHDEEKSPKQLRNEEEYQRQLRKIFWGSSQIPTRILSFHNNSDETRKLSKTQGLLQNNVTNPYEHDLFPVKFLSSSSNSPLDDCAPRRTKGSTLIHCFSLEAPNSQASTTLKRLISWKGPTLAVALNDQLFLWNNGDAELFTSTECGAPISCVSWNPTCTTVGDQRRSFLALGTLNSVEIWDMDLDSVLFEFDDHIGLVTAMCWNQTGDELLVASQIGMKRYILTNRGSILEEADVVHYMLHLLSEQNQEEKQQHFISCLVWQDNRIASAGDGMIEIWDANKRGDTIRPLYTVEHTGVCTLSFCPNRPNILVSGGADGLKFWNVQNGTIRVSIATEEAVADIVWSTDTELLVAQGDRLSIWKLDSKPIKTAERIARGGKILCMDRAPGREGPIVCMHENEVLSGWHCGNRKSTNIIPTRDSCALSELPVLR